MRKLLWMVSAALATNIGVFPSITQAQVVHATTHVHGLTCPFCSFGAKKKLKSVEGVKKVTIDVDKGLAILHAQPGQSIQLQQISQATHDAGFESGMIHAVAIGRIHRQGEQFHLALKDSDERLVLTPSESISQATLQELVDKPGDIQVSGVWSITPEQTHAQLIPDAITDP